MSPRKQKTLSVEFSENWIQSHMRAAVQMGKPLILEVAPACDCTFDFSSRGRHSLVQHAPAYGMLLQSCGAERWSTDDIRDWQGMAATHACLAMTCSFETRGWTCCTVCRLSVCVVVFA